MRLLPPAFVKDRQLLSVMDAMENVSGLSLLLLNDTGAATQQWKITNVAPTGSAPQYKITPRSGEEYETDWCMSAGTGGYYTGNGAVVMQMPYSAERGLWSFSEVEMRILNLNVFYDHSYNDRFTNASSRILTELEQTRMYYYDQFGIYINYSTPQLFTSTADECSDTCGCHPEENFCQVYNYQGNGVFHDPPFSSDRNAGTLMYKHAETLYNQWKAQDDQSDYFDEVATLIFTGYEHVCIFDNPDHRIANSNIPTVPSFKGLTLIPEDAYGLSSPRRIVTSLVTTQSTLELEKQIAMHELGHLFGTIDRDSDYHTSACTYNKSDANNLSEMTMCSACKTTISSNLDVYNHTFREVSQ